MPPRYDSISAKQMDNTPSLTETKTGETLMMCHSMNE